jgi:hypothetical protein
MLECEFVKLIKCTPNVQWPVGTGLHLHPLECDTFSYSYSKLFCFDVQVTGYFCIFALHGVVKCGKSILNVDEREYEISSKKVRSIELNIFRSMSHLDLLQL